MAETIVKGVETYHLNSKETIYMGVPGSLLKLVTSYFETLAKKSP